MNKFCLFFLTVLFCCFADSDRDKILYYNSLIPQDIELRARVLTTVFCDDCKDLPKCDHAGQVFYGPDGSYQLMHNGVKIIPDSYYGKWMTRLIELLQGHHEPQEERVFHEVLQSLPPHAVMVELGSYWGYYSLWFQQQVQCAINYLIEPDYKNLLIGERTFLLNQATGDFTQAMVGSCSACNQPFTNWDYETSPVTQICMDDFAKMKGISYIHLLHSDIQGAEVAMLEGCKELIRAQKIGYLFLSTHRGTHEKCLKALENTDLIILLSITREESFSADGLIVAKSPSMPGPSTFNISRRNGEIQQFIEEVAHAQVTR